MSLGYLLRHAPAFADMVQYDREAKLAEQREARS